MELECPNYYGILNKIFIKLIFNKYSSLILMDNCYVIKITDIKSTKILINTLKHLKEDNNIKIFFTNKGMNFNFITKFLTISNHVSIKLLDNNIPEDVELDYIIDPKLFIKFFVKRNKKDNLYILLHKTNKKNIILMEKILDTNKSIITKIKNQNTVCSFGDFYLKNNMKIISENQRCEFEIDLRYFDKIISDIIKSNESEYNMNKERIMISTVDNSIQIKSDDKYLNNYDIEENIIFLSQNDILGKVLKPLKQLYKQVIVKIYEKRMTLILNSENEGDLIIHNFIKNVI